MPILVIDLIAGPAGLVQGFSGPHTGVGLLVFRIGLSIEMDPLANRTLELRAFSRKFPKDAARPSVSTASPTTSLAIAFSLPIWLRQRARAIRHGTPRLALPMGIKDRGIRARGTPDGASDFGAQCTRFQPFSLIRPFD